MFLWTIWQLHINKCEQQISASSELAWHPLDVWMLLTLQQHENCDKTLTLISPRSQVAETVPTTCQTTAIGSIAAATKSSASCCCGWHFQGTSKQKHQDFIIHASIESRALWLCNRLASTIFSSFHTSVNYVPGMYLGHSTLAKLNSVRNQIFLRAARDLDI